MGSSRCLYTRRAINKHWIYTRLWCGVVLRLNEANRKLRLVVPVWLSFSRQEDYEDSLIALFKAQNIHTA